MESAYGLRNAQVYFSVMQGVLGCMVALTWMRPNRPLLLAVYVATAEFLNSVCSIDWYWFTPHSGDPALPMCSRSTGWYPYVLAFALFIYIIARTRSWTRNT